MRDTGLGESVSSRKPIGKGREIVGQEKFAEGPAGVPKAGEKGIESVALSLVEGARSEDVVTCLNDWGGRLRLHGRSKWWGWMAQIS